MKRFVKVIREATISYFGPVSAGYRLVKGVAVKAKQRVGQKISDLDKRYGAWRALRREQATIQSIADNMDEDEVNGQPMHILPYGTITRQTPMSNLAAEILESQRGGTIACKPGDPRSQNGKDWERAPRRG